MVVIAALLLLVLVILSVVSVFKMSGYEWRPKEYCDLHTDDSDRCMCFERHGIFDEFEEMSKTNKYAGWDDCFVSECRKKTIADLSCDELRDYFENGRRCEGVWPYRVCKYPKIDYGASITDSPDHHLLYQMVLKECTG